MAASALSSAMMESTGFPERFRNRPARRRKSFLMVRIWVKVQSGERLAVVRREGARAII